MKLTDAQCKEIISTLYRNGKSPAARISADWHSFGGRIGQYSHMIQYGSSKPREFDSLELERKLGGYDVIVEIHVPGMHGFTGWIPSSTEYSTNLDDVAKDCTYDSGTSIDIWKVPASIMRKIEKETKMESIITLGQLKKLVKESDDPLDSDNINSRSIYQWLYDVIYDYLDKNYKNFGVSETFSLSAGGRNNVKKYVNSLVSSIIDDVIFDIESEY